MRNKIFLSTLLAVMALFANVAACFAYPERPEDWRVQYEIYYFPVRLVSMATGIIWDVPTAIFQDAIKGTIGGTHMVARNLGNQSGPYDLCAGGLVGGPVGLVSGAAYGLIHGFGYGAWHGFMGYPSPHNGSHVSLFQGRQYVVPYDSDY